MRHGVKSECETAALLPTGQKQHAETPMIEGNRKGDSFLACRKASVENRLLELVATHEKREPILKMLALLSLITSNLRHLPKYGVRGSCPYIRL